jgi:folate-binding protein YgfZ
LREVLAKHREDKTCAACHARFDSLGLVFEGYGPIGEQRDRDLGGRPVDTRATFPGGSEGAGLEGLRHYLHQSREQEFLDNLCRKLLTYGFGRTLLLSDDVTIEDVTEKFSLFHVTGETAPTLPNETNWRRAKRFGTIGWDLVVGAAEHDRLLRLLSVKDSICDAECAERWRIERGVPRWGYELTDQIIPVEANLADEAIDYGKGCYIGQEVISRMKMSGQMNKRLCGLVSLDDSPLAPGARLLSPGDAKDAGWITSATRSDRLGKEIALGYVKRGFNQSRSLEVAPKYYEEQRQHRQMPARVEVPLLGRIAAGQPVEAIAGEDTLNFADFAGDRAISGEDHCDLRRCRFYAGKKRARLPRRKHRTGSVSVESCANFKHDGYVGAG